MGRKINLERPKKGPGRKARKQPEPVFQFGKDEDEDTNKKLSRHQKQRLKKREISKQKLKEERKKKKSVQKATKSAVNNTFDPAEIFNVEKSRQKYQQLGQKNKLQSSASNGHRNGGEKGRNLFDSDNEMEEDERQSASVAKGKAPVKKSQMKKFLQQAESEDESDSDEEDVDSDVQEEAEEDEEDAESVDGEETNHKHFQPTDPHSFSLSLYLSLSLSLYLYFCLWRLQKCPLDPRFPFHSDPATASMPIPSRSIPNCMSLSRFNGHHPSSAV